MPTGIDKEVADAGNATQKARQRPSYNLKAINSELCDMYVTCKNIIDGEESTSTDLHKDASNIIYGLDFIASELQIPMGDPSTKHSEVSIWCEECLTGRQQGFEDGHAQGYLRATEQIMKLDPKLREIGNHAIAWSTTDDAAQGLSEHKENHSECDKKKLTEVDGYLKDLKSKISSYLDHRGNECITKTEVEEPESFKVLVLSTAHYEIEDDAELEDLCSDSDMMMSRQHGYYIKLYNDAELNDKTCLSNSCRAIIKWALENGYRAVEFDCDADTYPDLFPVFEW